MYGSVLLKWGLGFHSGDLTAYDIISFENEKDHIDLPNSFEKIWHFC